MEDLILGIICLILALIFAVLLIIYGLSVDKMRKEYLSTLNEHELSIITKYNACCLFPFKNKGDKNK